VTKRRASALLFLFLLFTLIVLFLANAAAVGAGVKRGLSLCTGRILPSLFPFLVLSELFVLSGAGETLSCLLSLPMQRIFGLSGKGATALLLGMLCGLPVATSTAVSLYRENEMTKEELHRLLLFGNMPGLGFVVSGVGIGLFGSLTAGLLLFSFCLISTTVCGLFLFLTMGRGNTVKQDAHTPAAPLPIARLFTEAVTRAGRSLLVIFAFVIFFSALSACMTSLLAAKGGHTTLSALLGGMLEMTGGIFSTAALHPRSAFLLTAFLLGFSGFSVFLQIFSIAGENAPSPALFLLIRCLVGAFHYLLARLSLLFFSPTLTGSVNAMVSTNTRPWLYLAVLVLLIILLFIRIKKRTAQ